MRPRVILLAACSALAGCTTTVPLIRNANVGSVQPLPVVMEPPLQQLEDDTRDGTVTVIVPVGQLLAYHFPGVAPGTKPLATLHLIDSRLYFDSSAAQTAGALGLGAPLYLAMVDGYRCQYSLVVEAIMPDGTRRLVAGHGKGHAKVNGEAAISDAVVQAVNNLREQVDVLASTPSALPIPVAEQPNRP